MGPHLFALMSLCHQHSCQPLPYFLVVYDEAIDVLALGLLPLDICAVIHVRCVSF